MSTLQEEPNPAAVKPQEIKKEVKKEVRPGRQLGPPCVRDWEFWRFVLAALSLAWEIAKTFVR